MNQAGKITEILPRYAIPGGQISIEVEKFAVMSGGKNRVWAGDTECRIVAASSSRVLANLPDEIDTNSQIQLESDGLRTAEFPLTVGKLLADDMHIVANPAIDPSDGALILTRSGARGQQLPVTLFRREPDGYMDELPDAILNPTGIAFDQNGQMFVTNRAQGEVFSVDRDGTSSVYATGLGIATGIAFDKAGLMYVGDRSGTIFRIRDFAEVETFTVMDASVAAYHLAFGPDGRLFVTSPGLASHDAVHVIDHEGFDEPFFRGLGRPQGLAFDNAGNLYVAACFKGRHGVVRISPDGSECEHFLAGNSIVGLCFDRNGDIIVATGDSAYAVPCGIQGNLLS